MHLLPGNLIQVEGAGEAAPTAFVWCQLDTSPLLLCWQEICLSPRLQTSAKGERGPGGFEGHGGGGAMGLGPRFRSPKSLCLLRHCSAPLNISIKDLRLSSLSHIEVTLSSSAREGGEGSC